MASCLLPTWSKSCPGDLVVACPSPISKRVDGIRSWEDPSGSGSHGRRVLEPVDMFWSQSLPYPPFSNTTSKSNPSSLPPPSALIRLEAPGRCSAPRGTEPSCCGHLRSIPCRHVISQPPLITGLILEGLQSRRTKSPFRKAGERGGRKELAGAIAF